MNVRRGKRFRRSLIITSCVAQGRSFKNYFHYFLKIWLERIGCKKQTPATRALEWAGLHQVVQTGTAPRDGELEPGKGTTAFRGRCSEGRDGGGREASSLSRRGSELSGRRCRQPPAVCKRAEGLEEKMKRFDVEI